MSLRRRRRPVPRCRPTLPGRLRTVWLSSIARGAVSKRKSPGTAGEDSQPPPEARYFTVTVLVATPPALDVTFTDVGGVVKLLVLKVYAFDFAVQVIAPAGAAWASTNRVNVTLG